MDYLQTLEKLPDSLKNRFYLYLNVLPVLVTALQYGLLVFGAFMILMAIIRVSLKLSRSVQTSHRVSNHRKYSSIYPDMIPRLGDMEKVFELSEKSKKNSISRADLLNDGDSNSEKKFMLEEEPAISEDEGSECECRSNCDSVSAEVNKIFQRFYFFHDADFLNKIIQNFRKSN